MKRLLLLAVVLAVAISQADSVSAGMGGCTDFPVLSPLPGSFEQITVSSSSIGFTASKYQPDGQQPADMAVVTIETNSVRYRDDGVAPSSTVGQLSVASSTLTVCGLNSLRFVRFIRVTNDATLDVSYFRGGN